MILEGGCVAGLRGFPDASFDAVVCDPPYELAFMGKRWDATGVAFDPATWREVLRVLKPGAYLVAFGGTRTYHRLVCAIEDAGFEIRDQLAWLFGSGFPKSLDVSKAIDAAAGATRECTRAGEVRRDGAFDGWDTGDSASRPRFDDPATPAAAAAWQGWGTALKPAHEPICLARKPLIGTVATNVLAHGVGGLNIDGCRVGFQDEDDRRNAFPAGRVTSHGAGSLAGPGAAQEVTRTGFDAERSPLGRWPANLCHDGSDEVLAVFPAAPGQQRATGKRSSGTVYGAATQDGEGVKPRGDTGSAARFFYCPKASRRDRNEGCDEFAKKPLLQSSGDQSPGTFQSDGTDRSSRNAHPTVKPTELMRWLCRLVTPPGGVILDPFAGSGSTGKAAILEGFEFIGFEREPEYVAIANARIAHVRAAS